MRITTTSNCCVWGPVIGKGLSDYLDCEKTCYYKPMPGMLVTCCEGQRVEKRHDGLVRPGLGMIIAVVSRADPHGDEKFWCTVLWNF